MQPEYDPISEDIYRIEIKRRNKTMRIDPMTEAMLQAAVERLEQIEERDEEKLDAFRRRGVGLSKSEVVRHALKFYFNNSEGVFSRQPDIEDRQLTEGEKKAIRSSTTDGYINGSEGFIVLERARKVMDEIEMINEERSELSGVEEYKEDKEI